MATESPSDWRNATQGLSRYLGVQVGCKVVCRGLSLYSWADNGPFCRKLNQSM